MSTHHVKKNYVGLVFDKIVIYYRLCYNYVNDLVCRGEKMKKQHQMKLVIYLTLYTIGIILLIITLGLEFSFNKLALTFVIILLMVAHISYAYKYYLKESQQKDLKQLGYHIKKVGMETFNQFPVLTLVYNDKFIITWANYYSKQYIDPKIVNKKLIDIDQTLYEKMSLREYVCEIKGRIFEVKHNIELKTLYLIDVTSRERKLRDFEEKRLAVGYLVLDNLEEAVSDFTDQKRYLFIGRVNSTIMDYMAKKDILIKNYGEGKYFLLMEQRVLNQLIQDKFAILAKIRQESDQFETNLTISIGISANQESLVKLNDKAMEALEMTQNRGGDQVVLMLSEKNIKYFGGKSNVIEKRNRVRARVVAKELEELIDDSDKVVIMGHKIPDVDAFGSCVGIANIVKSSGKDYFIVIDPSEIDNTLQKVLTYLQENKGEMLSKIISPNVALDLITSNTLVVVVDTQNPKLLNEPKILSKAKKLVVIDHHRRGVEYIESPDLIYTEMYASSSVELISEIIEYYPTKLQINSLDATVMLSGIIVDTNNFTYRTGSRTFEAASFLRKHGADTLAVQTMLRESYHEHMLRANLFEKVEFTPDQMAIVVADNVGNLTNVKLAQTADWLLMIENVKASFVIGKIDEETVGVSSRSFGEVNVQLIMEKMNGGGHFNNAATQLKGISLQEAYQQLNLAIQEYMKEMENDEDHSNN